MVSGEVRQFSFAGRVRSFAGCCGTTLFFADNETAAAIDVAIASLDEPESYLPSRAIWVEDKLPWAILDPTRVTHERGGDSPMVAF
jgi:hypothetical protein